MIKNTVTKDFIKDFKQVQESVNMPKEIKFRLKNVLKSIIKIKKILPPKEITLTNVLVSIWDNILNYNTNITNKPEFKFKDRETILIQYLKSKDKEKLLEFSINTLPKNACVYDKKILELLIGDLLDSIICLDKYLYDLMEMDKKDPLFNKINLYMTHKLILSQIKNQNAIYKYLTKNKLYKLERPVFTKNNLVSLSICNTHVKFIELLNNVKYMIINNKKVNKR